MDSFMKPFYGFKNGCEFDDEQNVVKEFQPNDEQNVVKEFQPKDTSLDYDIVDLPLTSNVPDPVICSTDFSQRLDTDSLAVLKYINQVLMEDDLEDKACMIQDSFVWPFSGSKNGCEFDDESVSAYLDPNVVKGFHLKDTSLDYDIVDLPLTSNVPDPVICSTDFSKRLDTDSDAVLRYINQVLMEDDLEDKACMIQDSTLHAAEKHFYEILHKKNPSSPNQPRPHEDTSSSTGYRVTHCCSNCSSSCINDNNLVESGITSDLHKYKSSPLHNPYIDCTSLTNSQSFCSPSCSCQTVDGLADSLVNAPLDSQSGWPFNGGIEETKKILPSVNSGTSGFENNSLTLPVAKEKALKVKSKPRMDEGDLPDSLPRGRRSLDREESDLEERRNNKHLAAYTYTEDTVLYEMFDKVLSLYGKNEESAINTGDVAFPNGASGESQQNEQPKGYNGEMICTGKRVGKKKAVDMRSLLMQCMQSVAGNDHKNANKLLTQIRSCSSPSGDGSERLAHYFANSLEARLAGAGSLAYNALAASSMYYAHDLKVYKLHLSAFPFMMETSYFFGTEMIMELAEKATTLHIIHFGIMYGLQWPPLIQRLSTRPGGPPKLRITGIDLPQAGFRPDARAKETGRRLANYCERFKVPFEYKSIAQNWETVRVEDLRIQKDEVLVVNCLCQFKYIHDDTVLEHSPRDAVLNLIKRISPDIFIHGIASGTYNSPFLALRFREALFHFSALFDMFEANVPRENQDRMVFERDIWGKEILNVVACEGLERIARPETYKQWQTRTLRAGFKQLPLNQEITKEVRAKVNSCYHKDFFVDEASQWMLAGWKGRVIIALSCWKPA